MNRIGVFEKVTPSRFETDAKKHIGQSFLPELYDTIKLPLRATSDSAGYDFFAPCDIELCKGDSMVIPTGIRARIEEGWFLGIFPRSGLGFKYGISIANTVGIIDGDYYFAENEGHILIKLCNKSFDDTIRIKKDSAFAQGVFIPYGITYNDSTDTKRKGGFGSTGL